MAGFNLNGFVLVFAVIIMGPTVAVEAAPLVLITAESGGTQLGQSCNGGGNTVGWQFAVGASDLEATALGEFDQNDDGLGMDVEVGLWDSMGTLLGMVTVPSGTSPTLIGDFRYADLSPSVLLASGQTYTIGSRCTGQNLYAGGNSNYGPLDGASGTVSSDFASAAANGIFNNGGFSTTFSEPTMSLGGVGTFFSGPNLEYDLVTPTQTPTSSSTPTPSSTPTSSSTATTTPISTSTPTPTGPVITAVSVGTSTVSGFGRANLSATCITVHDCGPDGICGNSDDHPLGAGGTASNGSFDIEVTVALMCLERIYATDECASPAAMGPLFRIGCAPVPAMSPPSVAMLAAILGLMGLAGLGQLHRQR